MLCPCNSQKDFQACCQPLLKGTAQADSAEALMRSRYTAFQVQDFAYLKNTTDSQSRFNFDHAANEKWSEACEFIKLEILQVHEEPTKAKIEFKAYFRVRNNPSAQPQVHHEISKFRKQAGRWYFREGKVL